MSSLQRMIVIPPETFDCWKNLILEDKKLSVLDREMKNILYNPKLNDISKWHLYRQNLLKYLNSKRQVFDGVNKSLDKTTGWKQLVKDIDTQTMPVNRKNTKVQTVLPEAGPSFGTQTSFSYGKTMKSTDAIRPIEDVFGSSSRFSSLEMGDNSSDELTELDVDDEVRQKALDGQPSSVKIIRERMSLDPQEYRMFELNNGDAVTVPVEKQMITRLKLKRGRHPDKSQTTLDFIPRKKKSKPSSTPKKKKKNKSSAQKDLSWEGL